MKPVVLIERVQSGAFSYTRVADRAVTVQATSPAPLTADHVEWLRTEPQTILPPEQLEAMS